MVSTRTKAIAQPVVCLTTVKPEVPFPEAHKTTTTKGIRTHTLNLSTVEVGLGSKIWSSGSSLAKIKFEASLGNTRASLKKEKEVNNMLKHKNTLSDFTMSKLQ